MGFDINNRRYTGSKTKISEWIRGLIIQNCLGAKSFCDLFGGTGIITFSMISDYDDFIINDFLFSSEIIYRAFFSSGYYDEGKLFKFKNRYKSLKVDELNSNYVSENFGGKYFSLNDSKIIGYIRNDIENSKSILSPREFDILVTSLIYSFDRCANTVGHYDAYIKRKEISDAFNFELINPIIINGNQNKTVTIFREDSNLLAKKIKSDIVYLDPPYSSRQYSRFYHLIENIAKWEKPFLYGTALKPNIENISEYSKSKAIIAFNELIGNLNAKFIVVSYNNTYNSKSKSSENKMKLEDIEIILKGKGETTMYSIEHKAFNTGKTELINHKEILFITKVGGV